MDDDDLARRFAVEMDRSITTMKREIGYNPVRFQQMIGAHGHIETAKRLLKGQDTSDGFTRLWEAGRLDLSVEWFVLKYDMLFTDEERETAHRRLKLHEVPVDSWLKERLGRRRP
jgi:hypothetical protein